MPAYTFILTPGVQLPQDNGYLLLSSLARNLPFLHGNPDIQIAPVRGTRLRTNHTFIQTDHKSRLHIRGITLEQAQTIRGSWVAPMGRVLGIGDFHEEALKPSTYLASRLVILPDVVDKAEFKQALQGLLDGVTVNVGNSRALAMKGRKFIGYSVHLSDLDAETALRVQQEGIGKYTSMGCGVFYPGRARGSVAA